MNSPTDRDVLEAYPWLPKVIITDETKAVDPTSSDRAPIPE